jgi:hypothetical protein
MIETVTPTENTIRQITVDALDHAARIVQAVPDGRPKESYLATAHPEDIL